MEFPGKTLTVSCDKLYYQACCTDVSKKRSIIICHMGTARHKQEEAARVKQLERQQLVMKQFEAYRKQLESKLFFFNFFFCHRQKKENQKQIGLQKLIQTKKEMTNRQIWQR